MSAIYIQYEAKNINDMRRSIQGVRPCNGKNFSLDELLYYVHGYVEIIDLYNGKVLVVNEDGKSLNYKLNKYATQIYQDIFGGHDYIVDDVLLCNKNQIE